MKFVVDEMPFWESDCPFYNSATCTCALDHEDCFYMMRSAGDRREEECPWLKTAGAGKE